MRTSTIKTGIILAAAVVALAGLPAQSGPETAAPQKAAPQTAAPPKAALQTAEPLKTDLKAEVVTPDPLLDGARDFQRADYPAALASWQPLAVQGNPVAQNNLGILYLEGKGVPQDNSEAVRYLSLSAAAGSALGQNNLADCTATAKACRAIMSAPRNGSPRLPPKAIPPACTIWA